MTVKNLSEVSFDEILICFLKAFEGYYIKMPTDKTYYEKRWKAAKVDFNLSYGMFDKGNLVGFIIHAVDRRFGILTAFNTGTGVLPEYRGNRIVKSIYEYALKDLAENGIGKTTLEVIRENEIAVRMYEGVGFQICKYFKVYTGEIDIVNESGFELKEKPLKNVDWDWLPNQKYYSWDFQKETILELNYHYFELWHNNKAESFFIINKENKYLAQFDLLNDENNGWNRLFTGIKQISNSIKAINVDERLKKKITSISLLGLENSIDQYEMELTIETD